MRDDNLIDWAATNTIIEKLEAENEALKKTLKELLIASTKFNKRVLELVPFINSDRALAQNHGCEWTHGNWKTEREILESAIKKAKDKNEKETK